MKHFLILFVLLVPAWATLYSDENKDKAELDSLLQKELGVSPTSPSKQNKNTDTSKNENISSDKENVTKPSSEATEENLIQDRYSDSESSSSTAWLLIKVILVFGGLTAAMIFILRVMSKSRDSRFPVKGVMSILSSLPIATNKQIQIVDVAGRLLVLGVADSGVNFLTEITAIEEKNRILKMKEEFEPSQENFLVNLLESLKDFKPSSLGNRFDSANESHSFSSSVTSSSINDDELEELEKKHKLTFDRMKESSREIGLDPGLSGGKT
jgi:flagellar protein FliO/FliZ